MSAPTAQELSLAMAMIDRRTWRQPSQAVDMIRFLTIDSPDLPKDHYRELNDRQAATLLLGTPKRHRNARTILKNLVEDQVLEWVNGSGSRGTAYRINGAFSQWQNVKWRPSREVAMVKLSALAALYSTARANDSAVAHSTALDLIVPSSTSRQKKAAVPWNAVRHNDPLSAVLQSTAENGGESQERTTNSGLAKETSLSDEERERVFKIKGALKQKTGDKWIRGVPERQLEQLVLEGATTDELLALVASIPDGYRVPRGMEWICEEWHSRDVEMPVNEPIDFEARRRTDEITRLDRQIASLEAAGELEAAEDLRLERKQIEA